MLGPLNQWQEHLEMANWGVNTPVMIQSISAELVGIQDAPVTLALARVIMVVNWIG